MRAAFYLHWALRLDVVLGAQERQPRSGAHPLALQMPTARCWSPSGTHPLLLSLLRVCDTVQATSWLLQADCKKEVKQQEPVLSLLLSIPGKILERKQSTSAQIHTADSSPSFFGA